MTPIRSGVSKTSSQNGPPPPYPTGNSIFVAHSLEILSFLVEIKNKLCFIYMWHKILNFDPYTFFPKILVDTVTNKSAEGTNDLYRMRLA